MTKQVLKSLRSAALVMALAFGLVSVATPLTAAAANDYTVQGGADAAQGDDTPSDLTGNQGIFKTIVNVLLFIIGAIAVIMLIIGGIRYTISNGDSNQVTAAKNTILYAVIGIIVAILAYAIVNFVLGAFTG